MKWLDILLRSAWHRRGTLSLAVLSIALSVFLLLGVERLQQAARELVARRHAKADRAGQALALGDPVVRPARRQVQHVAGLEQPFLLGHEVGQDLQRHAGLQFGVGQAADAPAPRNHDTRFGRRAKAVANWAAVMIGTELMALFLQREFRWALLLEVVG